jgi:hypothetical protein
LNNWKFVNFILVLVNTSGSIFFFFSLASDKSSSSSYSLLAFANSLNNYFIKCIIHIPDIFSAGS